MIRRALILSGFAGIILLANSAVWAQAKLIDEVTITSEDNSEVINPYEGVEQRVADFFAALENDPKTMPRELTNEEYRYMAASYLFCSIKINECEDRLKELDVLDKFFASKRCDFSKKFWQHWLQDDMQKRQEFSVTTTMIGPISEFNRKLRPSYIECTNNYSNMTLPQRRAVFEKAKKFYTFLAKKVPNVFGKVGISVGL